jgi:hypothetical protein
MIESLQLLKVVNTSFILRTVLDVCIFCRLVVAVSKTDPVDLISKTKTPLIQRG